MEERRPLAVAPPPTPMIRSIAPALFVVVALASAGCDTANVESPPPPPPGLSDEPIPLIDFEAGEAYKGFEGGLYEGSDAPPALHVAAGEAARRAIEPLDAQGDPAPDGAVVLLSFGMSNVTEEFCSHLGAEAPTMPCTPWSFMGQALNDSNVDREDLIIVNGAVRGLAGESWDELGDGGYDFARQALAAAGVTPEQVQIVWTEVALTNEPSRDTLPAEDADAYYEMEVYGEVIRTLKAQYPNLRQVFLSSRAYGGYAGLETHTPEPWAYETGFAVKWLVEAQIEQRRAGTVGPITGDLLPDEVFVDWGPYLWANGAEPRSDGLRWLRSDFAADGLHPSPSGEEKVADLLLEFFKESPYTQCWFLAGRSCS